MKQLSGRFSRSRGGVAAILLLGAAVAEPQGTVPPLPGQAREEARRWQPDGLLVEINTSAGSDADRRHGSEALRSRKLQPAPRPDFASLRKEADAMAATQDPSFKLHQVEVELLSTTLEIEHADFHYSRQGPPRGMAPGNLSWEEVEVLVSTGVSTPRWGGSIGGRRRTGITGHPPSPAPATILAPEEAVRRLGRAPMPAPSLGRGEYLKPQPQRWRLRLQLILVGADYWVGRPGRHPNVLGRADRDADATFKQTAPRGKWVWWGLVQHVVPGRRYEFLYIDAIDGKTASHCVEDPTGGTEPQLIAVPCSPAGATGGAAASQPGVGGDPPRIGR